MIKTLDYAKNDDRGTNSMAVELTNGTVVIRGGATVAVYRAGEVPQATEDSIGQRPAPRRDAAPPVTDVDAPAALYVPCATVRDAEELFVYVLAAETAAACG